MNLSIAIVGLPNVGKSTLFSALTRRQVPAENYPFCTIEPNVGCVVVPDARLEKLAEIERSQKIIYATVDFVDVAGLVAGASKGEGLGNQFLSKIRECAAIAQVVRAFPDPNVTHVAGMVDPERDIKIIETELQLADLATVKKHLESVRGRAKTGDKQATGELVLCQKIETALNDGKSVRDLEFTEEELPVVKNLFLLTQKPMLYVLNLSEDQLPERANIAKEYQAVVEVGPQQPVEVPPRVIPICAKLEAELATLEKSEAQELLKSYGLTSSALDEVIKAAFAALGLIAFFTAGEKEARAWEIKSGATAPEAAGEIHSDFQKKFVKADVVAYQDFVTVGGWTNSYEKGKVRSEGKDYVMKDGDVVVFKHG